VGKGENDRKEGKKLRWGGSRGLGGGKNRLLNIGEGGPKTFEKKRIGGTVAAYSEGQAAGLRGGGEEGGDN